MKRIFYIFLVFTFFISCKKEDNSVPDFGYAYYPTEEGLYKIYDVIEVHHDDPSGIHDTTSYQLKTVIGERIIDLEGDSVNKFYRYLRDLPSDEWDLSDVWTIKTDTYRGELVEENQRVIKLVFPTNNGTAWNENAHNPMDPLTGMILNSGESHHMNSLIFDNTVRVRFDSLVNLIDQVYQYEIYAKDVGLVQVHWQDFEKVFATATPRLGDEHHWTLIENGFE